MTPPLQNVLGAPRAFNRINIVSFSAIQRKQYRVLDKVGF